MDDVNRSLVGGAGVALAVGAVAWVAAFLSTGASWIVAVFPAVGLFIVGVVLFLVGFHGRLKRPKFLPPWHRKENKRKAAVAKEQADRLEGRIKGFRQQVGDVYTEGLSLITLDENTFDEAAAGAWADQTASFIDSALGDLEAGLIYRPIGFLPNVTSPADLHVLRLQHLKGLGDQEDWRLQLLLKDSWQQDPPLADQPKP